MEDIVQVNGIVVLNGIPIPVSQLSQELKDQYNIQDEVKPSEDMEDPIQQK